MREISDAKVLQIAKEVMAFSRRNHPVSGVVELKERPAEVHKAFVIKFEDDFPDITVALRADSDEETVRNSIRVQVVARDSF